MCLRSVVVLHMTSILEDISCYTCISYVLSQIPYHYILYQHQHPIFNIHKHVLIIVNVFFFPTLY